MNIQAAARERFARKNEAEDLRRAFEILDTKKCAPTQAGSLVRRVAEAVNSHPPPSAPSDGSIDADELEQVFKHLGHKCKRVRRSADRRARPLA